MAQRIKLTELAPAVVEAFHKVEIGVGHALLLAKLQPAEQEQALAACFREDLAARLPNLARVAAPRQACATHPTGLVLQTI